MQALCDIGILEPHAPLNCCTHVALTGWMRTDILSRILSKGKVQRPMEKKRSVITCHATVLTTRGKEREHAGYFSQKEKIVAMTSLTPVHGFPRLELFLLWTSPNL